MKLKKLYAIIANLLLILQSFPFTVFAQDEIRSEEQRDGSSLVFQDFEDPATFDIYHSDNSVGKVDSAENFSGKNSLKYTNKISNDPGNAGIFIKNKTSMDVSNYKYLTFWIKDPGSNGAGVEVKDVNGNGTQWEWQTGADAVAGQWSQLSIALSSFKKQIDWTQVTEIMITEYWANDYSIDDITFTNVLETDLKIDFSVAPGSYTEPQEIMLTNANQADIYYTTDGSVPSLDSLKLEAPITIDTSTTIKAIAIKEGIISQVQTFDYTIRDTSEEWNLMNNQPTWIQTFDYAGDMFTLSPGGAEGKIINDSERSSNVLAYQVTESSSPEVSEGSVVVQTLRPVDISQLTYLIFSIKDTNGANNMKLSLIDAEGRETDYGADGWRNGLNTKKNEWTQYYVSINDLKGTVDLTNIVGVRLGMWNAGTYYIDSVYAADYLTTGEPDIVPEMPQASVADGYRFKESVTVQLANRAGDMIYYTLDGSVPTVDSEQYSEPIVIDSDVELKAVAFARDQLSEVTVLNYVKDNSVLNDVQADHKSGKYDQPFDVILTAEREALIYYTLDGTEPTSESLPYKEPIEISTSTQLKVMAIKGSQQSNTTIFDYRLPEVPTKPTFSIEEMVHYEGFQVEILGSSSGTTYYTTDGSEPTTDSKVYNEPLSINLSTQLKAVVVEDGLASEVATIDYRVVPKGVKADKPAGEYVSSTIVEFRGEVDSLEIYYTDDGSKPTEDGYELTPTAKAYRGPIKVTEDTRFQVIARYKNSSYFSDSQTLDYTIKDEIKLNQPQISPATGTYGERQSINILTTTKDAEIYYTLDGSEPSKNSKLFTTPFTVSKDTVVRAVAIKEGKTSEITTNQYTISQKSSPFLKVDGKVMRNNFGSGQVVQLKGTNVGGWLVMEDWQSPTNAPDQKTMLATLTERFGEEKAWELISQFQDTWFTVADFDKLKEEGVNLIRLPLTYFEMANEDGTLKEYGKERLEWFLCEAQERGIYVLVDMHGAFGSQNGKDHSGDISNPDVGHFFDNEENIQKTIRLWQEIAEVTKDNPWVAGYDLLNEPGGALGTEQFEVYDRLYDAIRQVDPDHIIHMQAIWEPMHLPDPDLYGWENVVYQYHFYGWDDINNLDYQKRFVDSKVTMVNEITNYDVPVFVGEFTFFGNVDSWDYGLSTFDEQGWSYTSWTYKVSGENSSWGMYTAPKTNKEVVDIYNDDYDTIFSKWSVTTDGFTRNDKIADVLSKHFKDNSYSKDTTKPEISGQDAEVEVGTNRSTAEIIDLQVKDDFDGVIYPERITISKEASQVTVSDFNPEKLGKQKIIVTASDTAGNKNEATFFITVSEKGEGDSGSEVPGDPDENATGPNNSHKDEKEPNNGSKKKAANNKQNKLPQTGDRSATYLVVIGCLLIILSSALLWMRDRRSKN